MVRGPPLPVRTIRGECDRELENAVNHYACCNDFGPLCETHALPAEKARTASRRPRPLIPFVLLTLLAVFVQSVSAYAADEILKSKLANGLQVIIVRNALAPVVSTAVNYFVGADETP